MKRNRNVKRKKKNHEYSEKKNNRKVTIIRIITQL